MKTMRYCLLLLFAVGLILLSGLASAARISGATVPLDTSAKGCPAWSPQSAQAVASSGSIFLGVWVDMRDLYTRDLYAARFSSTGYHMDPLGIRLTTNVSVVGRPDVSWNGDSFLVVFTATKGHAGTVICGLRVSTGGAVLDAQPILISPAGRMRNPCVSWDGNAHTVVWERTNTDGTGDILMQRLDKVGSLLKASPVSVSATSADERSPAVTSTGNRTIIVWSDERNAGATSTDIYGTTVSYSGTVSSPTGIPIVTDAGAQDYAAACWAYDHFVVVWTTEAGAVRGTTADPDGVPYPMAGFTVTSAQADSQSRPRLAFNGINTLVTWATYNRPPSTKLADIYANRLDDMGTVLDGNGFSVCSADDAQTVPAVAVCGRTYLISWLDRRNDVNAIPGRGCTTRAVRVASTGKLVGSQFPFALSSARPQRASSSAWNGSQYLVVWEEWHDGAWCLMGSITSIDAGVPVTGPAFPIASYTSSPVAPTVLWNGENFVVVWKSVNSVLAARITPDGLVLDPSGITVAASTTERYPLCAATDGRDCLICYGSAGVEAALMGRDGGIMRRTQVFSSTYLTSGDTDVCWTGEYYIVAGKGRISSGGSDGVIYKRLDRFGLIAGTTGVQIPGSVSAVGLRIAGNGANATLAWFDGGLKLARLQRDGVLIDTTPKSVPAVTSEEVGDFIWDGANYMLIWSVPRPITGLHTEWRDDIFIFRINSDGLPVDSTPIVVVNTPTSEYMPFIGAGPNRSLLTFSNWAGSPFQSMREQGLVLYDWNGMLSLLSLAETRNLQDNTMVNVTGERVSAAFPHPDGQPGVFYVQEDRSFGMRVESVQTVAPGDNVDIAGKLKNVNGERTIEAYVVGIASHDNPVPRPLGMQHKSLGGTAPNKRYEPILDGAGTYNVGLRVTTWGKVGYQGVGYFYIDDGSGLRDGSGKIGIKVIGSLPSSSAQFVAVTGISGAEHLSNDTIRVLRATNIGIIQ